MHQDYSHGIYSKSLTQNKEKERVDEDLSTGHVSQITKSGHVSTTLLATNVDTHDNAEIPKILIWILVIYWIIYRPSDHSFRGAPNPRNPTTATSSPPIFTASPQPRKTSCQQLYDRSIGRWATRRFSNQRFPHLPWSSPSRLMGSPQTCVD